jgi:hypothetical protein
MLYGDSVSTFFMYLVCSCWSCFVGSDFQEDEIVIYGMGPRMRKSEDYFAVFDGIIP